MKQQIAFENFPSFMKSKIFGQDHVIDAVADLLNISMAGLGDEDKPLASLLFTGPTGVGKTEFAKELAKFLDIHFERLDMSEYCDDYAANDLIGGHAGLVGYEEGGILTNAISKNPHCVLLLDEIEKADQSVYNTFLQVLDYGRLTDTKGKKVDFSNTIIIMTSNLGANESRGIGFGENVNINKESAVVDFLSPEFRNRLDQMLEFNPLSPKVADYVLNKHLDDFSQKLSQKDVTLTVSKKAKTLLNQKGFSVAMGARSIHREISKQLKSHIAKEIMSGELRDGGSVCIGVRNDRFTFKIEQKTKKVKKITKIKFPHDITHPSCPSCGTTMVQRVAKRGKYKGKSFYGCRDFPRCTEIVNM